MKRTRLNPMSAKRRAAIPERRAIREAVFRRDGGCLLKGVPGAGECFGPLTPHHKLKAGQGGGYTEDNLVALCQGHNDGLESDAELASLGCELGLVIRRDSLGEEGR